MRAGPASLPTPPARPDRGLSPDGRPLREVLSYSRSGSRLTPTQAAAWAAHSAEWVIPITDVDAPGFALTERFGRVAPLVVEIGSGVGEATGVLAAARPDNDVLALEVWVPGIAASLAEVAAAGARNVRFCAVDAAWAMEHLVAPGGLAELWTFFPDPWPKARHHKRRLVTPSFVALVASRLALGALWRLATDWPHYAEQMVRVLDAEPALVGGVVERWVDRPVTKFERKGIEAGRPIIDVAYRRR